MGSAGSCNPRALVDEICELARGTFPKNITLATEVDGRAWPVLGDPTQLHQVILNLCVNARDAMPRGGTLTLSLENLILDHNYASLSQSSKPGPYVLVKISDTGTGIPAAILDQVFHPYFTTKGEGKGTGLGLSTVVGIVKSHGGFVGVDSIVDRGSTFQVYLPAAPGATERTTTPGTIPERGNGELVLVVEDEEPIRDVLTTVLCKNGYRVLTARDGVEATSKYACHQNEIRAVVTDLDMPRMGGLVLIPVLRKINPRIPVLVSSGVDKDSPIERLIEREGLRVHLRKPYTADQVLAMVRSCLVTTPDKIAGTRPRAETAPCEDSVDLVARG